jgi:hypothetical protein
LLDQKFGPFVPEASWEFAKDDAPVQTLVTTTVG